MAQYNNVHLYGAVCSNVNVVRDKDSGKIINTTFYLITLTSKRRYEGGNEENYPEQNQVLVRSGVPEMAEKMAKLRLHDIITVKGTLNTRNVPLGIVCPVCSEKYNASPKSTEYTDALSMITFVTPIDIDIRETAIGDKSSIKLSRGLPNEELRGLLESDRSETLEYIAAHREMSNEIQVVGNLGTDPVRWEEGRATAYQVGINRNYYLKDDSPSAYSDFPYIRSYGRQADEDITHLQKGTLVLVDGFIRLRKFQRKSVCPNCGAEKDWKHTVLEIVPYTVQYLSDVEKRPYLENNDGRGEY